jgi:hypothetical protein
MNSAASIASKEPAANPASEPAVPPTGRSSAGDLHPGERPSTTRQRPMRRDPWQLLGKPRVAFSLVAVAIGIIAWSAWSRVPEARQARARVATVSRRPPTSPSPVFDPAKFAVLRADAQTAGDRLVRNRAEFRDQLTDIEQKAIAQGWRIETQVQPPMPGPEGLPELVLYPVTATLAAGVDRSAPAFDGLLRWLEGLSSSPKAIEITSMFLMGEPDGLTKARVELRLIGRADHEPHASK